MSERLTVSGDLNKQLGLANAALEDSDELSAPSYYRPEWPEKGLEGVVVDIQRQAQLAAGRLQGHEELFYQARLRGVDYLYGRAEEAITENVHNPLVDVVCLLTSVGDEGGDRSYQMAVEGKPVALALLSKTDISRKPRQRTYSGSNGTGKEFRTISRFGSQLSTVLRSLYVLAETSKQSPLILESTLESYAADFAGGKEAVPGTALGILEMLHNLGLKLDHRFYPLADQLREIVVTKNGGYPELKAKYTYGVMEDKHFWYVGETKYDGRRKLSYVESPNSAGEQNLSSKVKLDTPLIEDWQLVSRKRRELERKLRELTLYRSIAASAVNFSEEKAIKRVVADRLKKESLLAEVRTLERKELERVRGLWQNFIDREMSEDVSVSERERKLLLDASKLILKYFSQDETLSQKAKTNIGKLGEEGAEGYYGIDIGGRAKDPTFSWILYLRNPYVRQAFGQAIRENPDKAASFYLLLKVMTYDVLKKSLGKKELNFLFDPQYVQKFDKDSVIALFESIEGLVENYVPDVGAIVRDVLPGIDEAISDLLTPEKLARFRKKLEELTYKTLLDGFFKVDKSLAFTSEDRKMLRKTAKQILVTGVLSALLFTSYQVYKAVKEPIGTWYDALQERRTRAILARDAGRIAEEYEKREALIAIQTREGSALWAARQTLMREIAFRENSVTLPEESTRRAAEQARIPGEIGDRVPDRIRNEGDPLPKEAMGLTGFGRILHLPEGMNLADGEALGYFPWDINLQAELAKDIDTIDMFHRHLQMTGKVEILSSIDGLNVDFEPDQLGFSTNGVNPEMYPPIGWRYVDVYQAGGGAPQNGPMGELYFQADNLPARAIFVLEPVAQTELDPKIRVLEVDRIFGYFPYSVDERANKLTELLSGDPVLQDIHGRFISEAQDLNLKWERDYDIHFSDYLSQYSELGIKYAREYADYTVQNRYYALGFQIEDNPYGWEALVSLSEQPEKGYFCSVAAHAFRDFMSSAGFIAGNQPGIALHNYQGYLWGGWGHENNIVFLPDGRILEIDMTPYAGPETPESDLEFLRGRAVTDQDIRQAIDEQVKNMGDSSQGREPFDSDDEARRMLAENHRIERLKDAGTFITEASVNERLERIIQEADDLVKEEIRKMASFNGDIEYFSTGNNIHIDLLRTIMADARIAGKGAPTMLDIQLGKITPDQAYGEYFLLNEIAITAQRLEQSDLEIQHLRIIRDLATTIMEDMEAVAPELIAEGRENAEMRAEYESLLRDYYEKTGRFPSEATAEDMEWYKLESGRAWASVAANTPIGETELQFMNDNLLLAFKSDLKVFSREIALRTGDLPSSFELERRGSHYIPPAGMYNTQFFQLSSLLREEFKNNSEQYDKLTDEAKQTLNDLSSLNIDMYNLFSGTTPLSDREQLGQASNMLARIERLDNEIENIRFPQPEVEAEKKPFMSPDQWDAVSKTASALGAGTLALTAAYVGLKIAGGVKAEKKRLKTIEDALSKNRRLSRVEKDIILSTVGHICYLGYDKDFAKKAAEIVSLLENFEPEKHQEAIAWLVNEGADVLYGSSIEDSFYRLAGLTNGKARGTSKEEIMRTFPVPITQALVRVDTHSLGNNSNMPESVEMDIPHDYHVIYGLAQLILGKSIRALHDDVMERLGIPNKDARKSVPYKIDDFKEFLLEKYAGGDTPDTVKPLLNTIYMILRGAGENAEITIAD